MTDLRYLRAHAALPLGEQRRLLQDAPGRSFIDREPGPPGAALLRLLTAAAHAEAPVVVIAAAEVLGERVSAQAAHWALVLGVGATMRLPADPAGDAGSLTTAFIAAWEDRDRAQRQSARVRDAMRRRALRGEALGRPPYGYRVVQHRLTPDPDEAAVVAEIFRLAARERIGTRRIAQRLRQGGHTTRRGGEWSAASIGGVLRNQTYEGTYRRLGVVIPQAHEPLVERERFREVQALLDGRRVGGGRARAVAPYLFTGLARCSDCGGAMVGTRRRARGGTHSAARAAAPIVSYRCEANLNGGRCAPHTRREDVLVAAVQTALAHPASREARQARRPSAAGAPQTAPATAEQPHISAEFERRIGWLLSLAVDGRITPPQLRRRLATVGAREGERLQRWATHARAEAKASSLRPEAAAQRLLDRWERLGEPERRALLRRVVRDVLVSDDAISVVRA